MEGESSFSVVAPPVFDGEDYQVWAMRMEAFLDACDLWEAVEEDYENEYKGDERIRGMKVLNLVREFEMQHMKESETVKVYVERLSGIANKEQRRMMRQEGTTEGALQAKWQQNSGDKNKKWKGKKGAAGCSENAATESNSNTSSKGGKYSPCQYCGRKNHPHYKCWRKPDMRCRKCKKLGHAEIICKEKETQQQGQEVTNSGGAAMILINDTDNGYVTSVEAHVLPASHAGYKDGLGIKSYLNSTASPVATIKFEGTVTGLPDSPQVASFSSRGPTRVSPGILKPDVIGPGVRILAACHFQLMIGHVNPSEANNPGLVYDIQPDDDIPYLCGLGCSGKEIGLIARRSVKCSNYSSIPEAQLNYPSFSIKLGSNPQKYTRTETNVGLPSHLSSMKLLPHEM
ncbi:hypothetical protein GH714_009695 [Hevea brasiliensis]|uniref:DUF4219 domain-containing protein n=1 Tax=Hevea brasiliensis TaxID=3981 RepID=A0A6A6MMH0_HEVBR|nr:hypothetical protein GH714_009695 [Hevea brasiliensis]